jgi:hypothetical protein
MTDALDRESAMSVSATGGTGPAVSRSWVLLASAGGLVGAAALGTSFGMLPSPPPVNAPLAELIRYATSHQHLLMTAAWLEGTGTLLYVIFVLALVHLAGDLAGLAGRIATMASAVVVTVSLVYDVTLIAFAQSASLGGPQAATGLVSYGLFAAVEHVFLLAPPVLLPLGLILLRGRILPRPFAVVAVALGVATPVLGLVGLFTVTANNNGPVGAAINALVALDGLWVMAAAVILAVRGRRYDSAADER